MPAASTELTDALARASRKQYLQRVEAQNALIAKELEKRQGASDVDAQNSAVKTRELEELWRLRAIFLNVHIWLGAVVVLCYAFGALALKGKMQPSWRWAAWAGAFVLPVCFVVWPPANIRTLVLHGGQVLR